MLNLDTGWTSVSKLYMIAVIIAMQLFRLHFE